VYKTATKHTKAPHHIAHDLGPQIHTLEDSLLLGPGNAGRPWEKTRKKDNALCCKHTKRAWPKICLAQNCLRLGNRAGLCMFPAPAARDNRPASLQKCGKGSSSLHLQQPTLHPSIKQTSIHPLRRKIATHSGAAELKRGDTTRPDDSSTACNARTCVRMCTTSVMSGWVRVWATTQTQPHSRQTDSRLTED
jgi:hypothetical protein